MVVPNFVAALVLVPLLVLLVGFTVRLAPDAALPVGIHNALWALTILLVGTGLIEFRQSSLVAWGVLLVGLLFFNIGAWAGVGLARHREPIPRSVDLGLTTSRIGLISVRGLGVLGIAYLVGFGVYLVVIASRFGMSALVTDPTSIRAGSYLVSVPIWARLLLYIGPLLLALLLVKGGIDGRLRLWVRLVLIAGLAVSMVALLQRTNLFIGATWAVAAMLMTLGGPATSGFVSSPAQQDRARSGRRPFGARGLAVLGVVAIGMLVAFQVIGGALGKSGEKSDGSGEISPLLQGVGLVGPFRYLTTGVPAFLLLTESTNTAWPPTDAGRVVFGDYNPQTWGAATFEPIVSLIPGLRPWNPVAAFVDVGVQTNVFTWLEPFYRDFRTPGVALGAALLGLLITYLYATRHWSPRRFWTSALFLSMVFLATFVAKINSTPYLFGLLVVIAASGVSPGRYRPATVAALPGVP